MKIKFLTKVWPCLPLPPLSYCPTLPAKKSFPASEPLHRQPLAPARILLHYLKIGSLLSAEMPFPQRSPPGLVSAVLRVFSFTALILICSKIHMYSFTYLLSFSHIGQFYSLLSQQGLDNAWHIDYQFFFLF